MPEPQKTTRVLAPEEMCTALEKLTTVDKARLEKAARRFSSGLSITPQDLLQIAFEKAVSHERKCPADVPVVVFLARTMESLLDNYLTKREHDAHEQAMLSPDAEAEAAAIEGVASLDDPAEWLQAKQTLAALTEKIAENATDEMVFQGQLEGMSPQEIQDILEITPVQYASALTSIRRKSDKFF